MAKTRLATKRRRTACGGGILTILDLPDAALAKVGDFVPKISAALLAVALTAPPSSWRKGGWEGRPSPSGVAVMSSISSDAQGDTGWEIVDFAEIRRGPKYHKLKEEDESDESDESYGGDEEEDGAESGAEEEDSSHINADMTIGENTLANKLNDDDVGALLSCIDAVNKVKRLKLASCVSINGRGLEPLRGSLVLEQLDLSLVEEHVDPRIEPSPDISVKKVIPILQSIIRKEGCVLKHLQFPNKWKTVGSRKLATFISEYSALLGSRQIDCMHCHSVHPRNPPGMRELDWFSNNLEGIGNVQRFTCYKCLGSFCHRAYARTFDRNWCYKCQKHYCDFCLERSNCHGSCSNLLYCKECLNAMVCEVCDSDCLYCDSCFADAFKSCGKCKTTEERVCHGCSNIFKCESKVRCNGQTTYCEDCLMLCQYCCKVNCGDCYLSCDNKSCEEGNCIECSRYHDAVDGCESCGDYCRHCREKMVASGKASFCDECAEILTPGT